VYLYTNIVCVLSTIYNVFADNLVESLRETIS